MLVRSIAVSRLGPAVGLGIMRLMPTRLAYGLGNLFARLASRNPKTPMYQAIRANQAVVRGIPYDDPRLDNVVSEVLAMNARSLGDFFKAIAEGEEGVRKRCVFDEPINSKIADMNNTGGRSAGAIKAGLFLQRFVDKTSWAHLDIAGPAFIEKETRPDLPYGGTGVGVRTLVKYLESIA